MELFDSIVPQCVVSELKSEDKNSVLKELTNAVFSAGKITDAQAALSALMEREALGSTGVGEQVAIPHAKLPDIENIVLVIGISKNGIEFEAADGQPVKLFFMLLSPEKQLNLHLKTLAKISRLIKMTGFKARVLEKEMSSDEILSVLNEEEATLG